MKTKLKHARKNSNYSQQDLADALCISKSLYQKLEQGERKYTLDQMIKLSRFLNIELSELIEPFEFTTKPHFNFENMEKTDNEKVQEAIELLKVAESQDNVIGAVSIYETANLDNVLDELKDDYNDYLGDAQRLMIYEN
jgi:transcriptional regulator with XRE-family HTH domain